jgi:ribose-phosphate pyrophosphokinase
MPKDTNETIMLVAGSTHPDLAKAISEKMRLPLANRKIKPFKNGEIDVEYLQSLTGADVFIIQSCITGNVNDNIIETLLLIDAAKRAKAARVFLVQTIFPYQRQDRREMGDNRPKRKPVSARVMVNILNAVHVDGVITVKLHADQIEGFFDNNCIIENLDPTKLCIHYFEKIGVIKNEYEQGKEPLLAAPDVGAAKNTDATAQLLGLEYIIINKRRPGANESEVIHIIGDCAGRTCIMMDDLIDTGGTTIKACEKLLEKGAEDVYLFAPQGVFSDNAIGKLAASKFKKIVILDTIPNPKVLDYPDKFVVLPIAPFLAEVIANIHNLESLENIVKYKRPNGGE